jgi:histidinol dehydrogenase
VLRILSVEDPAHEPALAALGQREAVLPAVIEDAARDIIQQVRRDGDAALRTLTERFERRTLETIEIPKEAWQRAAREVKPDVMKAIELAASRVKAFHACEQRSSFEMRDGELWLGQRVDPLRRIGIYVPGGKARYPSTVIMTAVPARVAGVDEIVMVTPGPSPETLAAALVAGVDRVFNIGGAQAVAALAYGTATVPRVDKIVGPGNAYVAAAKRQVFGDVGIDSIAGPSEIVVAADDSVPPAWVAADLLAQAEHDELAVPILVAVGRAVADAVNAELARQLAQLPRRAIAERAVADHGAIIVVRSDEEAVAWVDRLAPEHAELALRRARELAPRVRAAGALFLGRFTPESVGDYVAGPSHVLPTGGSARFASPLSVADFLKRTSVIAYDEPTLRAQAADIERLAEVEGLDAHGRAVAIRFRPI